MIQANKLRVGNVLMYHALTVTVMAIGQHSATLGYFRDSIGFEREYTDADFPKPIPLTPEWLQRAGFVKEFDDVYSIGLPTGDGVDLLLEWGDCSLRRNHVGKEKKKGDKNPYDYAYIKSPKYVHQLQQLYFSLSGKELEFK